MPDYPEKYITAGNVIYKNRNKPFIKRALLGNKQPVFGLDEMGRPMTHLMSQVDNFAIPLLQYNNGQWADLRSKNLLDVLNQSFATNNFIEFNTPEEAEAFGRDYHIIMEKPEIIDYVKRNKKVFSKYIR